MLLFHKTVSNTPRTRTTVPNAHCVLLFSLADEMTVLFQQASSFSFTMRLISFGYNTNITRIQLFRCHDDMTRRLGFRTDAHISNSSSYTKIVHWSSWKSIVYKIFQQVVFRKKKTNWLLFLSQIKKKVLVGAIC